MCLLVFHPWAFTSCGNTQAPLSCWPLNKPRSWLWIPWVPWAVINQARPSPRPSCPSLYPNRSDSHKLWFPWPQTLGLVPSLWCLPLDRSDVADFKLLTPFLDLDRIGWLCGLSTTLSYLRGTHWPRGGLHSFPVLMWQSGQSLVPKACKGNCELAPASWAIWWRHSLRNLTSWQKKPKE